MKPMVATLLAAFALGCGGGRPAPSPAPVAAGRDPAVQRIDFEVLRRTGAFTAQVRISGVVRNVGALGFRSRPDQQNIQLYENQRLVQTARFQDLAPGEEVRVEYVRDWYAASPGEGEFPPTYHVLIVYDPDIFLDSNAENDDADLNDNRRQREGSELNTLVRGG